MHEPVEILLQALQRLLERLRRAGWPVGLGDFAAVQHLVRTLHRQGTLPDKTTLRGLLAPLLCRSPEQQTAFARHYDAWLQEEIFFAPAEQALEPLAPDAKPRRPRRWLVLLLLLVAAGALCYGYCGRPTPPPPVIPSVDPVPAPVPPPADISPAETPAPPPVIKKPPPPIQPAPELKKPADFRWLQWPALALTALAWLWWLIQRLNRRYLRRRLSNAPADFSRLQLSAPTRRLYQSAGLPAAALHRHHNVPGPDLDVTATLEATLRNQGLFTPVTGTVRQRPEYLVLQERLSPADQQARLVDALIARLRHEGVVISRWYYQDDPRFCHPEAASHPPLSLAELAARYPGWRLLIFGSGHTFIDPLNGQAAAWLNALSPWPQRALFTLEPPGQWRYLASLLGRENLLVAPADAYGLRRFLHSLHSDTRLAGGDPGRPYPPLLTDNDYLQRRPPPPAEQRALLHQLRTFLDDHGYRWLAACAVYPELHWPLTLYLGEKLAPACGDARGSASEDATLNRLSRLAVLPWLRHSYLPDWLRRALLDSLPRRQRTEVRELLLAVLQQPATAQGGFVTQLAQGGKGGSREQVCVDFLAGGLGLPLRGVVRPDAPRPRKLAWLAVFLTAMLGAVTGWQYQELRGSLRDGLMGWLPLTGEEQEISTPISNTKPFRDNQVEKHHPIAKPSSYSDNDLVDAYIYLNQIRVEAGMTVLNQNLLLEEAASGHAVYLAMNSLNGHYQNQSQFPAGFTGVTPENRASAVGYLYNKLIEVASVYVRENTAISSPKSIDNLMKDIDRRFAFLDFQMNEVGIGMAIGNTVVGEFIQSVLVCKLGVQTSKIAILTQNSNPAIVRWPATNSTGIPAGVYTDDTPAGYPISLQFNDAVYSSANVRNFKLYRVADGVEITNTHILTQTNDSNLTGLQFILVPLKHLEWGKAYRVEVDYTTNIDSGSLEWQFTTKCLGQPVVTVSGNDDSFSIPPGAQNFVVYVSSDQAYPTYQPPASTGLSLTVEQEDNNTYLFSTDGSDGHYFHFQLKDQNGFNTGSFTATVNDSATLPAVTCEGTSATTRLINMSTRANIRGGAGDAYAGFIIKGSGTQQILLRGIAVGSGTDPALILRKLNNGRWSSVDSNDEWENHANAAAMRNLSPNMRLPDRNGNDAGMLLNLAAGTYNIQLSSKGNNGLEVIGIDALDNNGPALINISTRAHISGGANDVVTGFIIKDSILQQVMIRGIAVDNGVNPVLTLLKLKNSTWQKILENNKWERHNNVAEVMALPTYLHLPDRNGNDAGMLVSLEPGVYSVLLSSKGAAGLAVVGVDVVK